VGHIHFLAGELFQGIGDGRNFDMAKAIEKCGIIACLSNGRALFCPDPGNWCESQESRTNRESKKQNDGASRMQEPQHNSSLKEQTRAL
jgi:hypothetical protein